MQTPISEFQAGDFCGIETFCRNAGASPEALRAFVDKVKNASTVALAVVWRCLTTNHATFTSKYCTQSSSCANWNCACDKHVRAQGAAAHRLLGTVFRFPVEGEGEGERTDGSPMLYFLPLTRCIDPPVAMTASDAENSASALGSASAPPPLPLQCNTSLQGRQQAMRAILSHPGTVKVTFNTQLALIPLLALVSTCSSVTAPVSTAATTGTTTSTTPPSPASSSPSLNTVEVARSFSDPRLAAYLCDSDVPEAELELESLFGKYLRGSGSGGAAGEGVATDRGWAGRVDRSHMNSAASAA